MRVKKLQHLCAQATTGLEIQGHYCRPTGMGPYNSAALHTNLRRSDGITFCVEDSKLFFMFFERFLGPQRVVENRMCRFRRAFINFMVENLCSDNGALVNRRKILCRALDCDRGLKLVGETRLAMRIRIRKNADEQPVPCAKSRPKNIFTVKSWKM